MGSEDFEILAVSIVARGLAAITPVAKAYKFTFSVLIDPEGTILSFYKANGIPQSFVINRDWISIKKIAGPLDWWTNFLTV